MDIQNNIIGLKTSATLAINELSQKLIKDGKEVFKFGLGQSPFPIPEVIVDELKKHAHQKDYINEYFYIILKICVRVYIFCVRVLLL